MDPFIVAVIFVVVCRRSIADCACGGDIGWNKVHEVVDGQMPGLVLNGEELLRLLAYCLAAAGV